MGGVPREIALPPGTRPGTIVVATSERCAYDGRIEPDEGFVVELES